MKAGKITHSFRVCILQTDRGYGRHLTAQLSAAFGPRVHFLPLESFQELLHHARSQFEPHLVVVDAKMASLLSNHPLLKGIPQMVLYPTFSPAHREELWLGMRTEEMVAALRKRLQQVAPDGTSSRPLLLVTGFDSQTRKASLRHWVDRQVQKGRPVFYFPFLPTYAFSLPLRFHAGPELSQLLVLLSSGVKPRPESLSQCFESQAEGYYALRLGGGSESLTQCPLNLQRELLWLFRSFIRSRGEPSIGVVEMSAFSFQKLRGLVGLFDVFTCNLPSGSDFSSQQARREINALLAHLPDTVQFVESPGAV